MTTSRLASFLALVSAAVSANAADVRFDDNQTFTLPASGTKTVSLIGTIDLASFEKDVEVIPGEFPHGPAGPGLDPQPSASLLAYEAANVLGADYHGPILDVVLTPDNGVGHYEGGWAWYSYGVYDPPEIGGAFMYHTPMFRANYSFNLAPVPETNSLAALGLGALALLRRSKRT